MVSLLGNSSGSLWKRKIPGEQIAQFQVAARIEEMEVHSSGQIEIWAGDASKTASVFHRIQLPRFSSEREFSDYLDNVSWKATQDTRLNEYYLKVNVRGVGGGAGCSTCCGDRKPTTKTFFEIALEKRERQLQKPFLQRFEKQKEKEQPNVLPSSFAHLQIAYFCGLPLGQIDHVFSDQKLNAEWQHYKYKNPRNTIDFFLVEVIRTLVDKQEAVYYNPRYGHAKYADTDFPPWIGELEKVGANVHHRLSSSNNTLLHVCCTFSDSSKDYRRSLLAAKLLEMGVSSSDQNDRIECIKHAIKHDHPSTFLALLKSFNISEITSLLDYAIENRNTFAATRLIQAGVDVTKGDPLALAKQYGLDDVHRLLLGKPEVAEKEKLKLQKEEEDRLVQLQRDEELKRKLEAQREQQAATLSEMILIGLSRDVYSQLERLKLIDELKKRLCILLLKNNSESLGAKQLTETLENLLSKKTYFNPEVNPPHIDWVSIEKYVGVTIQELKAANFSEEEKKQTLDRQEQARRKFEEEVRRDAQKKAEEVAQLRSAFQLKDQQDKERLEKLERDTQKANEAAASAHAAAGSAANKARDASLGRYVP